MLQTPSTRAVLRVQGTSGVAISGLRNYYWTARVVVDRFLNGKAHITNQAAITMRGMLSNSDE